MFNFQTIKNDRRGLTLVEAIVALGIFALVISGITEIYLSSLRSRGTIFDSLAAQGDARRSVESFVREMRAAAPSSLGSYPLESAVTSSVIFYSNIDQDNLVERVRYYLKGSILYKGIIKPGGTPLAYATSTEQIIELAGSVVNGVSSTFYYYDENYFDSSSPPLAYPIELTRVRLVGIDITIDRDKRRSPIPLEFESKAQIRNLKNN